MNRQTIRIKNPLAVIRSGIEKVTVKTGQALRRISRRTTRNPEYTA